MNAISWCWRMLQMLQEVHWAPLVEVPLLGDLKHDRAIARRSRGWWERSSQKARGRRWMEGQSCSDGEPKLWSSEPEMQKRSGSCRVAQICSANLQMKKVTWCDSEKKYLDQKLRPSTAPEQADIEDSCETSPFSSAEACHGQTWTLQAKDVAKFASRAEQAEQRAEAPLDLCYFTYRMAIEEILKPGFVPAWWDLSKRTSILTCFFELSLRRPGVSQPFLPQTNGFSFTI